jgi:general secretion pathway protein D
MRILLSASLLSLGILVSTASVAPAQTTPSKKKAIRPRPTVPDAKSLKKIKKPEGMSPINKGGKGGRYKPLKPTIRPRGVKPSKFKRPGERPGTMRPEKTPPGRTKHIRTPPMEGDAKAATEKRGPEGKGGPKVIEKDEKCRPLPPRVRVKMNFNEAEVIEIVQWISKQTCKNFIIGDNIRGGKITILSNTAVTANEAYRAFLSALNVNNMTVVKVGKFLKVQMKRDATKDTIPTFIGEEVDIPALDLMVTRVVQLKFVDSNNINATVKQLTTKDGDSYPYAPTNTLIISDTGSNLHRLMQIINQLDTPLGQEEIRVIQVEYAAATELAQTLEEIFGDKGQKQGRGRTQGSRRIKPVRPGKSATATPSVGGEGGEEGVSVSKIIADERTNMLILVATARSFPRVQELIAKLDVPIPGEGQIQVVYLQHADAEELASTLTSLAQGTTSRPKTSSARKGAKPGARGAPKAAELFQGEVKVTADKATNSLVIVASQQDYKSLLAVIKKLDIRRRQVFVEAVIMEVNVDTNKETGIAFHGGAATKVGGETIPMFFGTQFKVQGSNINSLVPNISLLGFMSGLSGPELSADQSILGSISLPSVGLVIHALQTDSNVNVLSTPHILTSDNEEAEIKVGENIPIPAGYGGGGYGGMSNLMGMASQYLGTQGTTGRTGYGGYGGMGGLGMMGMGMGAINRQEVGLTLKIKPQINEGNSIRMELEEELSEVKDTSNPLGPTTTKRSAKTVVVVEDQQTVVVGGLMRDKIDIGESKIPILGDIPVLGIFFRTKKHQKTKTNLLLFLTPYVIEGPEDFRRIFERKMKERKDFMERFYGEGPEYEAFIDFRKRHGPLADIHVTLRQEMMKIENGGPGTGREIVITPEGATKTPVVEEAPPVVEAPPAEEAPVAEEVPVEEPPPVAPEEESGENRLEVE